MHPSFVATTFLSLKVAFLHISRNFAGFYSAFSHNSQKKHSRGEEMPETVWLVLLALVNVHCWVVSVMAKVL